MNFRSCQYFLAVCEAGSINAAAAGLMITQQSLSEQIRRLERELGAELFVRGRRLTLTEAGRCMEASARRILLEVERLERCLEQLRVDQARTLSIGTVGYGIPGFILEMLERFLQEYPDTDVQTRDFRLSDTVPDSVSILFAPEAVEGPYACEPLFFDRLAFRATDDLLRSVYGKTWKAVQARLRRGELPAAAECPLLRVKDSHMEKWVTEVMEHFHMEPQYYPVTGSVMSLSPLCAGGKAAMITLSGIFDGEIPAYPIVGMEELIPAIFLCVRNDRALTDTQIDFLKACRKHFGKETAP